MSKRKREKDNSRLSSKSQIKDWVLRIEKKARDEDDMMSVFVVNFDDE